MVTKVLKIKGTVQGVGFRYQMCGVAISNNVKGWVRNCADGTVDAIVSGSEEDVNKVIEWSKKGPPLARVDSVDVTDGTGQFDDFEINHSV